MAAFGKEWKLDPLLMDNLQHIKEFFPIQQLVIPQLLACNVSQDFCVSAATGSGKTLVYLVPMVQKLLHRVICRLRGVIVVPTRDLAIQVKKVVDELVRGTKLKCGVAIGQSKLKAEQKAIVGKTGGAIDRLYDTESDKMDPRGGVSLVDILVCTPGRLVEHMEETPGFTLQHLQFLVVDEADRLLNQSYSDWIAKVCRNIYSVKNSKMDGMIDACSDRRADNVIPVPLQKVILSATLTSNPRKLASLELRNPTFLSLSSEKKEKEFSTPKNLEEFLLECNTGEKPLVLLQLLHELCSDGLVVVFTSSKNATHRLAILLSALDVGKVGEYSGNLSQKQRTDLMEGCRNGSIRVLVSSDAMARGIDMNNITSVVNYDMPSQIKTYIHRVGRTARAGRSGKSITLLQAGQVQQFWRTLKKANTNFVSKYQLNRTEMATRVEKYTEALTTLKEAVEAPSEFHRNVKQKN